MSAVKRQRPTAAQRCAERISTLLDELHEVGGYQWADILAGAHAEIVVTIALSYGGQTAAARCHHVAKQVEAIPTLAEIEELARPAMGCA